MKVLTLLLLTAFLCFGCSSKASTPYPASEDTAPSPTNSKRQTRGVTCKSPCLRGGDVSLEGKGETKILAPNSEYSSHAGKPLYRVWYGTNRKPINSWDESLGFSNVRDVMTHYGTCIVEVPKSHKFGSIGSSWVRRLVTLTDDRLKLRGIYPYDVKNFYGKMKNKLETRPTGKRTALVFIHGYNVSFEEAAIRAAQIGYDLKVEGITAFFSWPSKANFLKYSSDEATIETSEYYLEEFLRKIALESGAEEVHVIAHSMGNRGLLRVMERLEADTSFRPSSPFGQLILAAPDVDTANFKRLAGVYSAMAKRTTLYISSKDLALKASELLHEYPRAGFFPPITIIPGIDTIKVSGIDLTILGHSYIAEAAPVLNDMHQLLQSDRDPGDRARTQEVFTVDNRKFWEIKK